MINRINKKNFGLLVDFDQVVNFEFEGKQYEGLQGDTIASALWANNQKVISRSFKYHRPRGIFSMTGHDGNALVHLPLVGVSNIAADTYKINRNLKVKGQHYYGCLERDLLSGIGLLSRFLPVAFYYKSFYGNKSWDKFWHIIFRKLTGLGVINPVDKNKYYDKQYLFYDVVIIGAGIAGIVAALELDKYNVKVLLVDENSQLGGSLNFDRLDKEGTQAQTILQKYIPLLKESSVDIMLNTLCNSVYEDNWLSLVKDNRMYKLRAKQICFCSGYYQQPIVFHNNDLPGIMLTTGVQRLMRFYGVKPGNSAVVFTSDNHSYGVVLDLLEAGVNVQAVVDLRNQPEYDDLYESVKESNIPIMNGHSIYKANKDMITNTLKSVEIKPCDDKGNTLGKSIVIDCDLVCMSAGYIPAYHLPAFIGAKLDYDNNKNICFMSNLASNSHLIGSIANVSNPEKIIKQAEYKSSQIANLLGKDNKKNKAEDLLDGDYDKVESFCLPIIKHPKSKEFIDFDEDLQVCDLINGYKEGYEDIQLLKRFSTFGMGPAQGRYTAYNGMQLLAYLSKNKADTIGVTTARPPYAVEKIGHFAGRNFFPVRYSNMHYRHIEMKAQPLLAGMWIRPAYYGDVKNMQQHIANEVLNVHENVGVVDVSTLGGLEIRGPDAAEFINRVYTWAYLKQQVGRARYLVLTNDSGIVVDDGVACRLDEQHYYVTATTGGVQGVYLNFLKWNAQWRLDIDIANVTSAWCGINLAGPNSRKVLAKICDEIDISAQGFPYMGVREAKVAGIPARILRVGFVGELGYEIHVLQNYGEALWDAVIEAGKEFDIKPFGIEAQRVLRLQKGHIIISQDTDSMSYPNEVGLSWAVSMKKPFFVGKKSIEILSKKSDVRKLVGFKYTGKNALKESHFIFNTKDDLIGRITSVAYSPKLDYVIGLAYVTSDYSKVGSKVKVRCDKGIYDNVEVVSIPFYDPENKRQEL